MTDGAVDHDYDEAERDAETILVENRIELAKETGSPHRNIRHPDVVIDLVTRQHMLVLGRAADSLPEYYDEEGFDLYNYKTHPWLPVRLEDPVYKCVYLGDVDGLHHDSDTYGFPAGRLARVPVGARDAVDKVADEQVDGLGRNGHTVSGP